MGLFMFLTSRPSPPPPKKHAQGKGMDVSMTVHDDRGLLALQGPSAQAVLQKLTSTDLSKLYFGMFARFDINGAACWVTRTG
jgi:aminomethyltransferase